MRARPRQCPRGVIGTVVTYAAVGKRSLQKIAAIHAIKTSINDKRLEDDRRERERIALDQQRQRERIEREKQQERERKAREQQQERDRERRRQDQIRRQNESSCAIL